MKKTGDQVFDIRDYMAELFYAWKQIALATILIAAVIVCFGTYRNWRQSREESRVEQEKGQSTAVTSTRAVLNDAQAEEVEALYHQLIAYQNYRDILQKELSLIDPHMKYIYHQMFYHHIGRFFHNHHALY